MKDCDGVRISANFVRDFQRRDDGFVGAVRDKDFDPDNFDDVLF